MGPKPQMKENHRAEESLVSTDTGSGSETQSNEEKVLGDTILEPPAPKKRIESLLKKTTLCKHFVRGHCRFEDKCSYAHYTEELMPKPNLTKTRICAHFLAGRCSNENCTYAHGAREVQKAKSTQAKNAEGAPSVQLEATVPCKIQVVNLPSPPGLEKELGQTLPSPKQAYSQPPKAKEVKIPPPWAAEPMKISPFQDTAREADAVKPKQAGGASKQPGLQRAKKPGLVGSAGLVQRPAAQAPVQPELPSAMAYDFASKHALFELLRACEGSPQLSASMQCTIVQLFMTDPSLAAAFPGLFHQCMGYPPQPLVMA